MAWFDLRIRRTMASKHLCLVLMGIATFSFTAAQDTTTASPGHTHKGSYRTVCYTAGWARNRQDPVQFVPEDIDTDLCTHIIFAFAGLDKSGTLLMAHDPSKDPEMYRRLTDLKREKSHLKVLLSVGGWTMGSEEFTRTVSSSASMHAFARSAVEFLHRYNFDGLDVDWEFPAARGSPAGDKQRFSQLLQVLRREFSKDRHDTNRTPLMLTVAISPSPDRITQSYELLNISKYVDFMTAMAYDLHGDWEDTTGHHSALYSPSNNESDSIDYMINWILKTAIPIKKLNLGVPFYGRTVNLTNPSNSNLGAPTSGAGAGGNIIGEQGLMAYYEVCKLLTEQNDTITASGRLPGTQAPYVVDGNRWTSYDDIQSIKQKVDYVVQHGLGGVSIWSIDMDDFHGICGGGHYPLMNAIKNQYHQSIVG